MTIRQGTGLAALATIAVLGIGAPAAAQDPSLNYARLSSMEAPVAAEVGDVTLLLNGLVDGAVIHDRQADDATGAGLIGNLQISALTQLANRWRVGVRYFGQYADGPMPHADTEEGYTDNAALSAGGVWGTALAGNVSGVVREQTRRLRGAGNAFLAFDGPLGTLGELGGGYVGRFGPWVVSSAVDEDGDFDVGAVYRRPSGTADYRVAVRTTRAEYVAADSSRFDTTAAAVTGELIYGSSSFDLGVGCERFSSRRPDADRCYVSSGVRTKTGVVILSLEGHVGRIEGEDEVSAALGAQYDIARGLSANLGLNHARVRATVADVRFSETRTTSGVVSFRYSF